MNETMLKTFRNVPHFPAAGMSDWEIAALITQKVNNTGYFCHL